MKRCDAALRKTARPLKPFMRYSTCSAEDFLHPQYEEVCSLIKHPPVLHRKLWEWVFIIHHLRDRQMLGPGKRGLVFGVGDERLPSYFASTGSEIVATDAPPDIMQRSGFMATGQHANSLDTIYFPELVDPESFDRLVSFRACDMNHIDPALSGFDFNWSSCCFEHLGSIEAGQDFVMNAVEHTLRPGGLAVHTTEFNLSSNDDTVATGQTVIYRLRDIEALADRLRAHGHQVDPIALAPHSHRLDFHVDVPPYTLDPHLKLLLGEYVSTSIGLVRPRDQAAAVVAALHRWSG